MPKPPAGRPAGVPKPYLRAGSRKYQIKLKVPKAAGGPGQIARSLETDDYAEALRRAPLVAADIRREIEGRRRNADGSRKDHPGDLDAEQRRAAEWWARMRVPHPVEPARFVIPDELEAAWDADVERLLGDPIGEDERGEPVYDPGREAATRALVGEVTGERVPVDAELERYLEHEGVKASYASRTRLAVRQLQSWLRKRGADSLQGVTPRRALEFVEHAAGGDRTLLTVNSWVSALSAYWAWLKRRQLVERNPWEGQSRRVVSRERNADKRPFTDEEVTALLSGNATQTLHDLMRVAALSGMRLNEITTLRVRDAAEGVFRVRDGKTKASNRDVPIHPDLKGIVARRCRSKADDAYLFEELTAPPSRPNRRGGKIGERFTAYRRALEIDHRRDGVRQADADFHSFRRWFITKAEQAGVAESIIQAVVGHKRQGVTLGTYSAGPSLDQRKAAVAAVRLPEGAPVEQVAVS
jgi:integrase